MEATAAAANEVPVRAVYHRHTMSGAAVAMRIDRAVPAIETVVITIAVAVERAVAAATVAATGAATTTTTISRRRCTIRSVPLVPAVAVTALAGTAATAVGRRHRRAAAVVVVGRRAAAVGREDQRIMGMVRAEGNSITHRKVCSTSPCDRERHRR